MIALRDRNGYGNDAHCSTLIHCNGADASTTFTDASPSAHTVTANGGAAVSTAQSVFGGGSLYLDGNGDYLTCSDGTDYNFGTGPFSLDFWYRVAGSPTSRNCLLSNGVNNENGWMLWLNSGYFLFGDTHANHIAYLWTPTSNVWYHFAVCRHGSYMWLFINGVKSYTNSSCTFSAHDNQGGIHVGQQTRVGYPDYGIGYFDEIRISKGIARWTANFTPPTRAY